MLYAIIAAIIAAGAALATIDVQHKNNALLKEQLGTAQLQRQAAVDANKSLADSIEGVKAKCKAFAEPITKQTAIDKAKQAKARATIAAAAAKKDIKIEPLEASLSTPAAADRAGQCNAAETILNDLAKDRQ